MGWSDGYLHITFIEKNYLSFLKNVDQLDVDGRDLLKIINSENLKKVQKRKLIKIFDFNSISMDKEISNKIIEVLLPHSPIIVIDLLFFLFEYGTLNENKIKLLNAHFEKLEKDQIINLIRKLSNPYNKLAKIHKRPAIKNTNSNKRLLDKLQNENLIKWYKNEKGKLRVYNYNS